VAGLLLGQIMALGILAIAWIENPALLVVLIAAAVVDPVSAQTFCSIRFAARHG
jgi:hypothetical protein